MTRRPLPLLLLTLLAALLASLAGCANHGLTASGTFMITSGPEAPAGFNLPRDTRLDDAEASAAGRISGACELRRMAGADGDVWGVVADIHGGGNSALRNVLFLQRSDADPSAGTVEIELVTDPTSGAATIFRSRSGQPCNVTLDYVEPSGGLLSVTGSCTLSDTAGATRDVVYELQFVGCAVAQ